MNKTHTTMKKAFFLVAVATLTLLSCQKELGTTDQPVNHGLTFKASIEAFSDDTKATLNSDGELVWKGGDITASEASKQPDRIGVYVNDGSWTDKNQPFYLVGAGGDVEGEFVWEYGTFTNTNATVAFFPWEGQSNTQNNVYDGIAYFKLREEYWSYDNNKMLTPLVAPITYTDNTVNQPIKFKHAGAAVKLTINNLVGGTYHTTMSVTGKQITGGFHINPADAGTAALALDAAEDTDQNHVTLHAWKSSGAFSWIFPVPELTKPKFSFEIVDENGVTVWSKNLKAQSQDVNRGQILALPAQTITPYSKFVQDASCEWAFCGNINGGAWQEDVQMMKDGKYWILAGCTFAAGDQFKIRKNKSYDEDYPSGAYNNWVFTSELAGTKDIIFNSDTKEIKVVAHKFPYPEPDFSYMSSSSSISIDGDMSDWSFINSLTSTGTDRIRSWKFYSDTDNLYFYLVLRKNRMSTASKLTIGLSWDDSGSFSGDNLNGLEAVVVFQPFTNASQGTPSCVNGTINSATINGTEVSDAGIVAYGSDPNSSDVSNSADYYLEVSIPKNKIPSLPASGTIQAGAGYNWYNTTLQDITL